MSHQNELKTTTTFAKVTNSRSDEVQFRLEPWGELYAMAPGSAFQVIFTAPTPGLMEVEVGDDHVTVYGWVGSTVRLLHDGTDAGAGMGERGRVPPIPGAG